MWRGVVPPAALTAVSRALRRGAPFFAHGWRHVMEGGDNGDSTEADRTGHKLRKRGGTIEQKRPPGDLVVHGRLYGIHDKRADLEAAEASTARKARRAAAAAVEVASDAVSAADYTYDAGSSSSDEALAERIARSGGAAGEEENSRNSDDSDDNNGSGGAGAVPRFWMNLSPAATPQEREVCQTICCCPFIAQVADKSAREI